MIVLHQRRIYRQDCRANLHALYLFGDNLDRQGLGGQAAEMRGEPNAFGIATKRGIGHGYPQDYFFDHEPDVVGIVDREFALLQCHLEYNSYSVIIIPLDGLGTGLSRLPETAPNLLEYINKRLKGLHNL